ncbi:SpoIIE family protein phosphatase [Geothrix sp. 21YS21S-4]|uniref:SpoIIE family protein phosphatase n=1 Tax=Geothrix sp. 21YS21S-4 TaxID=3068889 RepID=UPI0027BA273A|nr:SpoIIE family protein phosphatase [Geothrix sp. 21YS21S-4]
MNPYLKRIRWRLLWISLACVLLSTGSFALNQWMYAASDDQCSWVVENGKIIIREILPDGVAEEAGLLEGDELVKIQGRTFPATLEGTLKAQRFINEKPANAYLIYTVKRQGRQILIPVRLVKPINLVQLALLLNGLVAWAIGLLVVLSAPERKSSRHFFYLAATALLLSGIIASGNAPTAIRVGIALMATVSVALLPPLWVHFFLRFPHPFALRRNRRFLRALYGTFAAMALIQLSVRLWFILNDGAVRPPVGGPETILRTLLGAIPAPLYAAAALTGLGFFVAGAFRASERLRRAVLPSLIVAAALCLDLVAWSVLQGRYGTSLLFQRQTFIFMLPAPLLPLSFAYAIFRHGLFDVRKVLLRWVSYMAILALTVALYLGGLAWAFSHLASIPSGWAGALIGLLALPLGWALRLLLRGIRRRFRRDFSSTREIALGAVREPRKRFSEEALLKSLRRALSEAFQPQLLEILPIEDRQILLPAAESEGRDDRRVRFPPQPLHLPAGLLRLARENRELVLGLGSEEADWIREQGEHLRAHVDALEAQLLLLILAGDQAHTAVLLGGKYAELNYGREDRELLREVALAAGQVLETAVMHGRLLAQERLSQELETARRIQESLITSQLPPIPGFHVALRLEPALETGGDLLFVKRRPSGAWLAAVGDVCGKGLAAALYMAQATALLEQAVQREDQGLEEILCSLDRTLRQLLGQRGFLTLILLEWDERGNYRLARAGHPGALLLKGLPEDCFTEVIPKGRGLGLRPAGPGDWEVIEGTLPPKGWMVLYSDGLSEAMNRQGELYGTDRLCGQLRRLWGTGSPRAACEAVFQDVSAFDTQNRDDRTLFILGREHA